MSNIERLRQIRLEIAELVDTLTEQKRSKEEKKSTEIKKLSICNSNRTIALIPGAHEMRISISGHMTRKI